MPTALAKQTPCKSGIDADSDTSFFTRERVALHNSSLAGNFADFPVFLPAAVVIPLENNELEAYQSNLAVTIMSVPQYLTWYALDFGVSARCRLRWW